MRHGWRKFLSGLTAISLAAGGAIASLTMAAAPAHAADVVVVASDFEDGFAPWTGRGSAQLSLSDDARTGSQALLVSNRSEGWHGPQLDVSTLFTAGEYHVTGWVKLPAGAAATQLNFGVNQPNTTGEDGWNEYPWVGSRLDVTADAWVQLDGYYTVNAQNPPTVLYIESASADAEFLVDDIEITAPEPEPDYLTVLSSDFEGESTAPWTPRGPASLTLVPDAHSGAQALQVSGRTDTWNGARVAAEDVFTAGNVAYSISAWVKLAAGQEPAEVNFGVNQPNATGEDGWNQYPWVTNRVAVTDAAWVQLIGSFTPDADNPPVELYVEASTTATLLVDDVLITAPRPGGDGPPPGTVLIDTDFERSTLQGWVPRLPDATAPTLALVEDGADGTAHSAQVSDRDNDGDGMQFDVSGVAGLGGTTLEFEAWLRFADGEDPGEATLSARTVRDGSETFSNLASLTGLRNDGWTRVGGQFTMPAFDTAAELYFETLYQSGNTSTFRVDQVRVWVPEPPVVQTDLEPLKNTVDFPLGVAIDSRETTGNPAVLVNHHFNQITAENHMKVEAWYDADRNFRTHPEALTLLDFAQANNLRLYGHVLLWHSQTPDWFFTDDTGRQLENNDADRAFLRDRLATHIDNIARDLSDRYGLFGSATNPLVAWDVVNEVVSDSAQDDGLRRSAWYAVFGEDYIPLAFELADAAFNQTYAVPDSEVERPVALFINDYNTEQGLKQDQYFALVQRLLAAGVPVDGVGHQFHVSLTTPVSSLQAALDRFAPLDVVQAVTELDVTIGTPVTTANLVRQGHYYRDAFRVFRQHQAAEGDLFSVTLWGLTDNRSWRSAQAPLLFDAGLQAKPAYFGAVDSDDLPPLQVAANVFGGDVPLATAADSVAWRNLPAQQLTNESGSFIPRWSADHLTLLVTVAADSSDAVEIDYAGTTYRVGSDGTAVVPVAVFDDAAGWRAAVQLPHSEVVSGGSAQLDVRVLAGATVVGAWNSPGATGTLNFLEDLSTVDVAAAPAVPVIDGAIDDAWQAASSVHTSRTVEGNAAGATADVRTLWADDTLYVLYEVSDPELDVSGSDPWVQDSVELFIDAGNAKNGGYRDADAQLRISATNVRSFGTGDQAAQDARLTSATAEVDGGYVVELAVTLLGQGGADTFQGLDFQVNDGRGGTRYSVHTWAEPTGTGYQTTARWGVGHLLPAPAPEPVPPAEADLVDSARGGVQAPPTARQGEWVELVVGTAPASQAVHVWLFSEPVYLLGGVVSPQGTLSVQIPVDAAVGPHKIAVTDLLGELVGWDDIAIGAPGDAAVNLAPPTIKGKPMVGATVKADNGSWAAKPKVKLKYAYQWNLDGVPIRKATKSSYRIAAGDLGKQLTVTVTVSAKGLDPVSATSAPVTVLAKPIINKAKPKVLGVPLSGLPVVAYRGRWDPANAKLSFQWLVDGSAVPGATSHLYRVRSADVGKRLAVRVTAKAAGHESLAVTSASVKVVGLKKR